MFDNFSKISSKIMTKTASICKSKIVRNIHRSHTASLSSNKLSKPWILKVKKSILWNKFSILMSKRNSSLLTILTQSFKSMRRIETPVVPIQIAQIRLLSQVLASTNLEVLLKLPFQEKIQVLRSLLLKLNKNRLQYLTLTKYRVFIKNRMKSKERDTKIR